jgi:ribosomal protein S14
MAKVSSVQKNKNRTNLVQKFANKRAKLKAIAKDRSLSPEEQFEARLKLAALPRNSSKTRIRNRCELTGRPAPSTGNLSCAALCCVNWPLRARFPAWSSRAGKEDRRWL